MAGEEANKADVDRESEGIYVIKFFTCYGLADPPINGGFFLLHNIKV
jgi:hypothetical protein